MSNKKKGVETEHIFLRLSGFRIFSWDVLYIMDLIWEIVDLCPRSNTVFTQNLNRRTQLLNHQNTQLYQNSDTIY